MERLILALVFLLMWKLGDPWLNEHILLLREKNCDRLEAVLKIKLDQTWMRRRIHALKYLRYSILLITFDIRFIYLYAFMVVFIYKSPYLRDRKSVV